MYKFLFAVVLALIFPFSLDAPQGDFSYITASGQGLQGDLTLTSESFVKDFFAFANFDEDGMEPPSDYDPDFAYEITRFRLVDTKPKAYDMLYYYPDQGYVFYYGLADGTSKYDQRWYKANPAMEAPFRAALAESARLNWRPFGVFLVLLVIFVVAYARASRKRE